MLNQPTSSPMMTTMFGFLDDPAACAAAPSCPVPALVEGMTPRVAATKPSIVPSPRHTSAPVVRVFMIDLLHEVLGNRGRVASSPSRSVPAALHPGFLLSRFQVALARVEPLDQVRQRLEHAEDADDDQAVADPQVPVREVFVKRA